MKHLTAIILILWLVSNNAFAQANGDTTVSATAPALEQMSASSNNSHMLKKPDAYLPRWALDFNFKLANLRQNAQMIDLKQTYTNSLDRSRYPDPKYTNGKTIGGDISLDYFFSRNRHWGVSVGVMYLQHTGSMQIDSFIADYHENFASDPAKEYRQIIHNTIPIQEDQKMTVINIPILAKYKWNFAKRGKRLGFGLNVEGGFVLGVQNTTEATAHGNFTYEGIYRLSQDKDADIFGFDINNPPDQSYSLALIESAYHGTHDNAIAYFNSMHSQEGGGFNVGLERDIAPNMSKGTNRYNMSLGAMMQVGITYQLSYHTAFMLNGYAMYQNWKNTGNEKDYRITEKVVDAENTSYVDYHTLTGGIKTSDYLGYGVSAGFRVYFGEQADLDDDGVKDKEDECPDIWGLDLFKGCPDSDNDGVSDAADACPYQAGRPDFEGCPDTDDDGWPDHLDLCKLEPGSLRGCPVSTKEGPTVNNLPTETGTTLPPHVVLETDMLHFSFGRSNITDSAAAILKYAQGVLEQEAQVVIYISGYTDDIGSDQSNIVLSYKRAKAAKNYLIGIGVPAERIIIGAYGKEYPIAPNDSPNSRAKNRRIEMKLLRPL